VKEGISKDPKYDYGEDEELHVLVTGENQSDVSPGSTGMAAGIDLDMSEYMQCIL
jgi:hypothetical protein